MLHCIDQFRFACRGQRKHAVSGMSDFGFESGYDVCYAVTGMWDLEVVMMCASVFPFLVST